MIFGFYAAAAAMVVVALALVLVPMIRHARDEGRQRQVFMLALVITLLIPLCTVGLYLTVGTPVALNGVPKQTPINIDQAIAELQQHLKDKPDDVQGWQLLAQTYSQMHKTANARDAYGKVLALDPNNTAAMVGWAEADSIERHDHMIDGHALELLERSVQLEPDNQRGLWLLGISRFQHGRYDDALTAWRQLQPLLEPGSKVAQAVAEQIAVAQARAGGAMQPATPESAPNGPALDIEVSIAPALQDKLATGDVLFVYARAEQGPPMPLAVAKLTPGTWPIHVTLTDAMAMAPQMKLSSASRVFVGARISKSGQATAQSGDLEGDAGVVDVASKTPIKITLDKVH
ncbi:c-type cytochrome biogenesis protein CcmI/CycH [Dyella sp.]|uniref:tetratricopeptide repeat protein n=1 Tax=Dyella sp. TaxID=1869338 RepID=UPI002ECFAE3E